MLTIITTGGTIDKIYFDALSQYSVGSPQAELILQEAGATLPHRIVPLLRKDSLELTHGDRLLIRETVEAQVDRCIVITHGTDTMRETALALEGIAEKTIVFTGAMQPASHRASDAEFNLGMAVAAAQCLPAGVYLALQGRIFQPGNVRKNRAENRFEEVEPEKGGSSSSANAGSSL